MKIDHLFPLIVLAALALGCSQIRDLAGEGNATNTGTSSNTAEPANGTASDSAGIAPSGDPTADINRMADAFLEQRSFRATMVGSGTTPVNIEFEYISPDRFRIKNAQGPETVIIGKDLYLEMNGRWQKMPGGLGASIPDIRKAWDKEGRKWISDAKYVGEETVNGKLTSVYTYHNKGAEGVGENDSKMWISKADGLPVRIEANYKSGTLKSMQIDYFYDENISIEPPTD